MKRAIRHSSRHTLLKAILIGFIPAVSGMLLAYCLADKKLAEASVSAAHEADRQISIMVDEAAAASKSLMAQADQPCELVTQQLREQLTQYRFIRSVDMALNNRIYCTSLYGSRHLSAINPEDFYHGMLRLFSDSKDASEVPVLMYKLDSGNKSVLVGIDGRHIQDALYLIDKNSHLVIKVGNQWMRSRGEVQSAPFENYPLQPQAIFSEKYGYVIYSAYPAGAVLTYAINNYLYLMGLLIILGGVLGALVYWRLGRVLAPSKELQRAFKAKEFLPYVQPVISSTTNEWVGMEVLIRWRHPQEGLIQPDSFVPLAESTGLIVPMTRELMRMTAEQFAPCVSSFSAPFHIGFNITARHFETLDLIEDCKTFLNAFTPGSIILVLEITERELIKPTETVLALIDQLKALGVCVAIDDFGTGHSSLAYLHSFKVDYLKIDQSFVSMIGVEALSVHVLDSIVDLALKLDLQVIAEGIETEEQRNYLGACGVDFMQGYLFAKPMPISNFCKLLSQQKP